MPRVADMHGRGRGLVPDAVLIGPAVRVVARMKRVCHLADRPDDNIWGQNRVEAVLKPYRVERRGGLKGGHLAQRVNPCVCSPGYPYANGRIQNPG